MPESHIHSVRTDDLDINYEVVIKELNESVSDNVKELAKLLCVINFLTPPEERDSIRNKYAKKKLEIEWQIKQSQLQVDHKQLEWKIMTMIREKKFNQRIRELFLKRYDDICHQLIELWEEGVSLDEMSESDYRVSVEDVMVIRNLFHDE